MSPSLTPLPSTPTALASLIHNTLTHFCAATPSCNYRSGVFAREITPQVSVTSCLDYLASSPHTTPDEREVFLKARTLLNCLPQPGNAGCVFSPREMERHALIVAKLVEVFEKNQCNRGVLLMEDMEGVGKTVEKGVGNMKGEELVVTVLLQMTQDALVLACASPKGYKAGVFRNAVEHSTPLLVALGTLSTDPRVPAQEIEVFEEAKVKVAELLEVQKAGQGRERQEQGMLYEEYPRWFKGVLGVFERDCQRREVRAPEWVWYGSEI